MACRSHTNTFLVVSLTLAMIILTAGISFATDARPTSRVAGFTLSDTEGNTITEASLAGRPTLLFFGFTYCPVICPTTLFEMSNTLEELGATADRINIVFVSVDPQRDTVETLRAYLANFDPRIRGLTGSPDQIAALASSLGARISRSNVEGGDYTMDHSILHYLIREDWTKAGTIFMGQGANPKRTLARLRRFIDANPDR